MQPPIPTRNTVRWTTVKLNSDLLAISEGSKSAVMKQTSIGEFTKSEDEATPPASIEL